MLWVQTLYETTLCVIHKLLSLGILCVRLMYFCGVPSDTEYIFLMANKCSCSKFPYKFLKKELTALTISLSSFKSSRNRTRTHYSLSTVSLLNDCQITLSSYKRVFLFLTSLKAKYTLDTISPCNFQLNQRTRKQKFK